MRNFLLSLLMICCASFVSGQSTIAFQGFETGDTWLITSNSNSANITSAQGIGDVPMNQRVRSGTNSYQVNNSTDEFELSSQNIANYFGNKFSLRVSSTSASSGNGSDSPDEVKVYVSLDGGTTFPSTPDITLQGNNNARWGYDASLTGSTVAGSPITLQAPQGGTNTNNYTLLEVNIPDGTGSVAVKIQINNNASNEFWNIDDLELTGTLSNTAIVGFDAASSAENETNTPFNVDVPVTLSNYQGSPVDLTVNVTGGSAEMTDYILNTTSLSFTGDGSQNVSLTLNDDAGFDDETIELTIAETTTTGAVISVGTHTITLVDDEEPPAPLLVINELLADPDGTIDANGDGAINNSFDEFVEIVNTGSEPIDIGGYRISDGFGVRFTFPANTILLGGTAATVFGGGTPTNIPGLTFTAVLGLNNGGDVVTLDDGTSSRSDIDTYTYGNNESQGVSLARSPDFIGAFVPHSDIVSNPVLASPGRSNTSGIALPVDLTSFIGTSNKQKVNLHWTTASEINNDFFEVQRSTDRQSFETIGKVKGNGTTTLEQLYEFTDRNPASGINYYRLAQYDFNGDMEYHKVISVELRGNNTNIYPTITADVINVEIGAPSTVHILTMDGKLIDAHNLEQSDRLDVSSLPAGLYYLRVQTNGNLETHRFIKK